MGLLATPGFPLPIRPFIGARHDVLGSRYLTPYTHHGLDVRHFRLVQSSIAQVDAVQKSRITGWADQGRVGEPRGDRICRWTGKARGALRLRGGRWPSCWAG